jgi:hypothetical protein
MLITKSSSTNTKYRRQFIIWSLALWLCQLLDIITTSLALRNGYTESNPIAAMLISNNEYLVYALKFLWITIIIALVWYLRRFFDYVWQALLISTIFYVAVVVWNTMIWLGLL